MTCGHLNLDAGSQTRTENNSCQLCGRSGMPLTRHHLIPRTRHSNKRNKKLFRRDDVKQRLALLCRACHSMCHSVLTEKEMEAGYATLAALASHPEIARFVEWVRHKPAGFQPRVRRVKGGKGEGLSSLMPLDRARDAEYTGGA